MKNLLLSKKLRITVFRLAILDIFSRYENSISTDQIENDLGKFDRITLYRTLKIFKENGIIHEITMPGNIKKLALCASQCSEHHHEHKHIHFHCNTCEEVYCLEVPTFPEIGLMGFKVENLEIQANGICQNCV
jgi:Fur family ferric uptake transcriptional regulator